MGHTSNVCPSNMGAWKGPIVCHYCGEPGHTRPNCPNKPGVKVKDARAVRTTLEACAATLPLRPAAAPSHPRFSPPAQMRKKRTTRQEAEDTIVVRAAPPEGVAA